MGRMICKVHGNVAFWDTCQHVAKELDKGQVPLGHRFWNMYLCDACFSGFEPYDNLISLPMTDAMARADDDQWKAFEAAYNALEGRRSFCVECVAALERKNP